jgi:hypothetical protein
MEAGKAYWCPEKGAGHKIESDHRVLRDAVEMAVTAEAKPARPAKVS